MKKMHTVRPISVSCAFGVSVQAAMGLCYNAKGRGDIAEQMFENAIRQCEKCQGHYALTWPSSLEAETLARLDKTRYACTASYSRRWTVRQGFGTRAAPALFVQSLQQTCAIDLGKLINTTQDLRAFVGFIALKFVVARNPTQRAIFRGRSKRAPLVQLRAAQMLKSRSDTASASNSVKNLELNTTELPTTVPSDRHHNAKQRLTDIGSSQLLNNVDEMRGTNPSGVSTLFSKLKGTKGKLLCADWQMKTFYFR
ncbi:hypothetical protein PHYSODRAFT_306223 [Phytophthora sojae]|uniref:Uncharacterized protein n=1 Tax=Phytophthora sojae (strain P6497) TaxID=1094619 RepID=G5A8G9_PHYSP|nr:hypothetical protein PHYSODRAFT_306223 [Phytophthora sojae]EGZ08195.1 hypothetical protein PHYSODRAFT_306223 [Phytophthora sojae]|eukprot:XP_009536367.1 hypothetical protein PHYSODRAFT_306223 [Phytophthora sojae]